ncbi:lactoylglutathione lyase [Anaerocolumna jejuensis DSM 15929]|uniref:Lactoylglutathione lyase n=1 Tax=Anaerocolumna jejuensis DSM 15929 TaxID=1121322 RepID=A0A1M6QSZ2_9FIRM|nr:VOC family protein [Anaerocolumna jejuensis]SHK23233.1 lactoylglutathione lyase [Anaerocolumna jejuensis DSM 15929]
MHFSWCTVNVNNLEESLKFYQDIAGLPLVRRFFAGPGQEIAFLGSDDTKLELICRKDTKAVEFGKDISIGFMTESLEDFMKKLKEKNIPIAAGPISPEPSTRFLFVKDPNGLTVQFSEHLNP